MADGMGRACQWFEAGAMGQRDGGRTSTMLMDSVINVFGPLLLGHQNRSSINTKIALVRLDTRYHHVGSDSGVHTTTPMRYH